MKIKGMTVVRCPTAGEWVCPGHVVVRKDKQNKAD